MSEQLKFRAYDKWNDYYYYQGNKNLAQFFQIVQMAIDGENKVIIEQFIGMYDSTKWEELTEKERDQWTIDGNMPSEWKGKEIYKGDIVQRKISRAGKDHTEKSVVVFSDGGFCLKEGKNEFSFGRYKTKPTLLKERIIGNINKNPELL